MTCVSKICRNGVTFNNTQPAARFGGLPVIGRCSVPAPLVEALSQIEKPAGFRHADTRGASPADKKGIRRLIDLLSTILDLRFPILIPSHLYTRFPVKCAVMHSDAVS